MGIFMDRVLGCHHFGRPHDRLDPTSTLAHVTFYAEHLFPPGTAEGSRASLTRTNQLQPLCSSSTVDPRGELPSFIAKTGRPRSAAKPSFATRLLRSLMQRCSDAMSASLRKSP